VNNLSISSLAMTENSSDLDHSPGTPQCMYVSDQTTRLLRCWGSEIDVVMQRKTLVAAGYFTEHPQGLK